MVPRVKGTRWIVWGSQGTALKRDGAWNAREKKMGAGNTSPHVSANRNKAPEFYPRTRSEYNREMQGGGENQGRGEKYEWGYAAYSNTMMCISSDYREVFCAKRHMDREGRPRLNREITKKHKQKKRNFQNIPKNTAQVKHRILPPQTKRSWK